MKRPEQFPIHKAIGVTVRFRSGQAVTFTCANITINVDAFAKIVGYNWRSAKGAPLYIDPSAIESVVTYPVLRWRGWQKAKVMSPVVDAEANAAVGGPLPDPGKVH